MIKLEGKGMFFTDGISRYKQCSCCKEFKLATTDNYHKGGKVREFNAKCKQCKASKTFKSVIHINEAGHLWCSHCRIYQPIDCFTNNSKMIYRRHKALFCKTCVRKQYLKYYKKDTYEDIDVYIKRAIAHIKSRVKKEKYKKRNIICDINFKQIKNLFIEQKGICALTGTPLTAIMHGKHVDTNISFDRINSDFGYTIDNIQLVCTQANFMKGNMTHEKLKEWCLKIINTV